MARFGIGIEKELNGLKGYGEIAFIKDDGFNAPHWSVFVTVPYQESKWHYLGGSSLTQEEAIKRAEKDLQYSLESCIYI